MNDDLPEGWVRVRLAEGVVTNVQTGFACGTHNRLARGIAHLRPMNVSEAGTIDLSSVKFVPSSEAAREERLVRRGDVLFNNTNSPELVGKTAHYDDTEPQAFSNHMTRVRCRPEALDARFCAMALHQRWREGYFNAVCNNHVSQASVSRTVLLNTAIDIPPLAEQRRIVEKVEALLARVNAARDSLARVPAILKRFRQSVLAAACSGSLTQDWRMRHTHSESPSPRLARILQDRKALWRQRSAARRSSRVAKYRPPFEASESIGVDMPETWAWVTVSHLALLDVGFAFKSAEFANSGVRLLRGENVEPGRLRWADVRFWPRHRAKEFEHLIVEPGDIILAMDRPLVSAGLKVARATSQDAPCLLVQRVMRFKMVHVSDTDYLYLALQEKRFIDFLTHEGMTGSDLPHITGTGVAEFSVPLPPPAEQEEIVRRANALFTLADAIERRVATAIMRADKMLQAILAKAFRGELLPTEAELARKEGRDYEPAAVLLERIRAARTTGTIGDEQRRPRRRRLAKRQRKTARRDVANTRRSGR